MAKPSAFHHLSVHQQDAKSSLLDERATAHISRTIDGGLFKHL
jgi:hypothetical protein